LLQKESHNPINQKEAVVSQFDQWDAAAYVRIAALSEYRDFDALSTLLTANFISFAAEYTRGEVISAFQMDVDQQNGLLGMMSSYTAGILGMGEHFEDKLINQKKSPTRAQIETNNMIKLDLWSSTAPVGQLFVWNSPPGLVSEGYAGLNSHSFIFVYEKTSPTTVVLHQYRTWMSLQDHLDFQKFITQNEGFDNSSRIDSHKIINNTQIVSPKDLNCSTTLECVSLLEKKAYSSSDSWKVKPHEMPQIDEQKYAQFRDFLLSLYISKVIPLLLSKVPEVESHTDPLWMNFVQSKEYAQLIKQLDIAFGILAYQPLIKWVEGSDTNNTNKTNYLKLMKSNNTSDLQIQDLTQDKVKNGLLKIYDLNVRKLHGQKIQSDLVDEHNSLSNMLLSTTSKGLSLGQCGIGTFIPTRMMSEQILSAIPGIPIPTIPGMLTSLGPKEKIEALHYLNTLQYLPLRLSNGETWFIKAEHHKEYSDFFKSNSLQLSEDGIPIGPCGWALRGDSRGNDDLVLTKSEHAQLEALRQNLKNDLLNNPEQSFSVLESAFKKGVSNNEDMKSFDYVLFLLKESLKKSVDVSDLLFNEFFDSVRILAHPILLYLSKKVNLSEFVLEPEKTAKKIITVFQANQNEFKSQIASFSK